MPFDPYFSEIRYRGGGSTDFAEIALDNGEDPSTISIVVYNANGTIRSTNALNATPDATIAGTDVYTVSAAIHRNGAVALVQNGTVISYVSFDRAVTATEGPASGLTSTQIGTTGQGESLTSTDHGASYTVNTTPDPGTIPCFLSGTLIATPDGPRPVESLRAGMQVMTLDHGPRRLIWTGASRVDPGAAPEQAPVCIPAGAFGAGLPRRDLFVSPPHRLLVAGAGLELMTGSAEALIPAGHLLGWRGVAQMRNDAPVWYHHLLLGRHEIVLAEGLPSESFHPALANLSGFHRLARAELEALRPGLVTRPETYGPTARPCLKAFETRAMIAGPAPRLARVA